MNSFTLKELTQLIRDVPDFPRPGVVFKDFSPLLEKPGALHSLIDHLAQLVEDVELDSIACVESRGFLLAAPLATKLKTGLYLIRKKGKLPPPVNQVSYDLEYGKDILEMRSCRERILLIDDVLATGGTLNAAAKLIELGGGTLVAALVVLDLKFLNQFEFKGIKARSLIQIPS